MEGAPERGERAQGGQGCCGKQRRGGQQCEGAIKRRKIKIKKIKKIKNKDLQRVRISLKESLVRTYLGGCKWLRESVIGG